MQVHTSSLAELETMIGKLNPDCVVSLVPEPSRIPGRTHVRAPIPDIYNRQLAAYKDAIRMVIATRGDVVLVHCEMGQSRSAALAIIKAFADDPTGAAAKRFLIEYPDAQPNPLLLMLGDEILKLDGLIVRFCRGLYKGAQL